MEDNYEGLIETRGCKADAKTLVSQLKERETLLQVKRRWLMDLPLSKREQKRVKELLPPNDKTIPESFLREDDVRYEYTKTFVELGYGAHGYKKDNLGFVEDDLILLDSPNDIKDVVFLLDDMTNIGLYSLAKILTGGLIKFEKTSQCMKKIIKEFLPKVLSDKNNINEKLKLISILLKDAKMFRGNQVVNSNPSEVYRSVGIKLLDELEEFCTITLTAMHRRVRGVKGYIPTIQSRKSGWSRGDLIKTLRIKCKKMLLCIGEGEEPVEELAGALGVAGLSLKLILNRPAAINFRKFPPEVEALQNDVAKAIWLLNDWKKVSVEELAALKHSLDPKSVVSVKSLRKKIRNWLTDYLFECSDLDEVPKGFLKTLDIINNKSPHPGIVKHFSARISSRKELMEEEIQEEVENVLIISAQAKQVVLNSLPEHEFDQDFTHAYVEELDESVTFCVSDDDAEIGSVPPYCVLHSHELFNETESIGESSSPSIHKTNGSRLLHSQGKVRINLESNHMSKMDSDKTNDFGHSTGGDEPKEPHSQYRDNNLHNSECNGEIGVPYLYPTKVEVEENLSSVSPLMDRNSIMSKTGAGEIINNSTATQKLEYCDTPQGDKIFSSHQNRTANKYLAMQEACDVMSMAAYRFVGHKLKEFCKMERLKLSGADRSYLRSNASIPEDFEDFRHI